LATPAVRVEGLVKVYSHGVTALGGIDLEVEEGSVHAVVGPNGAGKTTLMRILTTQIPPTRGRAEVFGHDVRREGGAVRRLIGYVPQEFSVWTDITGYENLLFYAKLYGIGGDRRGRLIREVLELMDLEEASRRLVRTYSGGMIRRLEIAAALMVSPRILLLDEPTIGLDPRAREVVWRRLLEFRNERGTTVLFNTHYMDEAERYAEEVTVLNMGRVVASGSPKDLTRLVGGETVRLRIAGSPEAAANAVKALDNVFVLSVEPGELIAEVGDSSVALPLMISALEKANVRVEASLVKKPTLDEVFIKLTGMTVEQAEKRLGAREAASMRRAIRRGG